MKILRLALLATVIIVLFLGMIVYFFLKSTLPETSGMLRAEGIRAPIRIARDRWGVPIIQAGDMNDLAFAVGFVHAQDRLFQMDLSRRLALGRLSEVFGRRSLDVDIRQRESLGAEAIRKTQEQLSPTLLAFLEHYCRGVNCFIETQNLPPEFHLLGYAPEPWQVRDTIGIQKNMEQMLTYDGDELRNAQALKVLGQKRAQELLGPTDPLSVIGSDEIADAFSRPRGPRVNGLPFYGSVESSAGSNNWVVAGGRTLSGKPLLASDPHLSHRFPGLFYQIRARAGDREWVGNTLPGAPLLIIGRNGEIGWGLTFLYTDVTDYFILKTNPQDPNQYWLDGRWQNFQLRSQQIKIRGGGEEPVRIKVSVFGPVFKAADGRTLAVHSIFTYPTTSLTAFFHLNQARTVSEALAALRLFSCPSHHVVFASRSGEIGYYPAGWIPRRASGDGSQPQRGTSFSQRWQGFLPEQKKPFLLNPKKGYIVTANNPPLPLAASGLFTPYNYFMFRAERIDELLRAKAKVGVEDMKLIQGDTYHKGAEFLIARLKGLTFHSADARFVAQILSQWNDYIDEGPAPALFYWFEHFLTRNIFADDLPAPAFDSDISDSWTYKILGYPGVRKLDDPELESWLDDRHTPEPETFTDVAEKSLLEAYSRFRQQTKKSADPGRWENLHQVAFDHPLGSLFILKPFLNRGPFSMPGGADTVMTASFDIETGFRVNFLSAFRMILDFSDFGRSQIVYPAGQSGHFMSPNYDDQIALYTNHRYRNMEEKAEKHLRLTLLPAKAARSH